MRHTWTIPIGAAIAALSAWAQPAQEAYIVGEVLYSDDFDRGLAQWVVEQQPGGTAKIRDGRLEIDDRKGCTIWLKTPLEGAVMIEYEVVVIKKGGPNDRGSDLNCFWMARDPKSPDDLMANRAARQGRFKNYHPLRLYYVGYGANNNTTTRFRRYPGGGERPMLPEHDLRDPKYMLRYNAPIKIQIVARGEAIQYLRDGEIVIDFRDPEPFTSGWFGFRTVRNHMTVDKFRVYQLKPAGN